MAEAGASSSQLKNILTGNLSRLRLKYIETIESRKQAIVGILSPSEPEKKHQRIEKIELNSINLTNC